jgi:hypothetical protein
VARRGGLSIGGGGSSAPMLMIVGVVGGLIADMIWYSLGLPGYNVPIQGCQTITLGDAIQLGGTGALTFFGFLTKSRDIPAFTFGLMLGGLFPKIVTKAIGIPRYGIFDIDVTTGQISPIGPMGGLRGQLSGSLPPGGQPGAGVGGESVAPKPAKTQPRTQQVGDIYSKLTGGAV